MATTKKAGRGAAAGMGKTAKPMREVPLMPMKKGGKVGKAGGKNC